jgi:ubiquinone/menaquinone biosynthesis C-methylase UbiE
MELPTHPFNIYQYLEDNTFVKYKTDVMDATMRLESGYKVLDVGGGYGSSDILIAKRVGKYGKVVNIDGTEIMCQMADKHAMEHGVGGIIEARHRFVSKESPIPYPDNYFDISYANRILCVSLTKEYKFVLSEMYRVTKHGGKVIASCPDPSSISTSITSLEEEFLIAQSIRKLWGDRYPFAQNPLSEFQQVGLSELEFDSHAVVDRDLLGGSAIEMLDQILDIFPQYFTTDKYNRVIEAVQDNTYYASVNIFVASGVKEEIYNGRYLDYINDINDEIEDEDFDETSDQSYQEELVTVTSSDNTDLENTVS